MSTVAPAPDSAATTRAGPSVSPERAQVVAKFIRTKFRVRAWVGEPYVGKRMKLFHLHRVLRDIELPAGASVLECGSGDGVFSEWLSRFYPQSRVHGIELDPFEAHGCEEWARANGRSRLSFSQGNVLELPDEDAHDLIVCLDVLEHITEDAAAVRRMARALKPGGWLVTHTPALWYRRFDGSMHTVPPEEAWKINPGHVRNGYTLEGMRALLEQAGLADVRVLGRHGRYSDVAHEAYRWFERPAVLRVASIPITDVLTRLDAAFPGPHGNTVFGIARKPLR